MTTTGLTRVVAATRELLAAHGQDSRAAWLEEREHTLRTADSPETIESTIAELHSIVLGMGGLFDLPLSATSAEAGSAARARLDELADQLFDLTRPT